MGIIEIKEVLEEFKKKIKKDHSLWLICERRCHRRVIQGEDIDMMIDIVTEMKYGVLISVYPNPISKGEKDVMKCYEILQYNLINS